MLLQWLRILLDNTFTVVHRPRACHTNTDSLSRRHLATHNHRANFSEHSNQSLKRKVNSFLRQEEQKDKRIVCDICQILFPTVAKLQVHLHSHPDSDLKEAFISQKEIAKTIFDQELADRKLSNRNIIGCKRFQQSFGQ